MKTKGKNKDVGDLMKIEDRSTVYKGPWEEGKY